MIEWDEPYLRHLSIQVKWPYEVGYKINFANYISLVLEVVRRD